MIDWDVWTVDDVDGNRIECRKVVALDPIQAIAFVIRGARVEPDTDPDGPSHSAAFDSFTIDGREPSETEHDEYSDDLRAIVWDSFTDS
jgi:hypothetical protein